MLLHLISCPMAVHVISKVVLNTVRPGRPCVVPSCIKSGTPCPMSYKFVQNTVRTACPMLVQGTHWSYGQIIYAMSTGQCQWAWRATKIFQHNNSFSPSQKLKHPHNHLFTLFLGSKSVWWGLVMIPDLHNEGTLPAMDKDEMCRADIVCNMLFYVQVQCQVQSIAVKSELK